MQSILSKALTRSQVGDGLNDIPSLATAGVGIGLQRNSTSNVVGGSVTIVNSRLRSVVELYEIAEMTMSQVHFNIGWIVAYNAVTLSLATNLVAPFGFRLSP